MPDFARVKKWPSCEQNDIIFVWYHAEEDEPSWQPTPIPQIQNGEVWYRGRNEFLVNSHIQVRTNGVNLQSKRYLNLAICKWGLVMSNFGGQSSAVTSFLLLRESATYYCVLDTGTGCSRMCFV